MAIPQPTLNKTKFKKKLSAVLKTARNKPEGEFEAYIADRVIDIIVELLSGVKVVLPKQNVVIENQQGLFEKVLDNIEGHLEL